MGQSASTPTLAETLSDVPRVPRGVWRRMGWLRRWLIASRAAVLPLTLLSALFGGLLAAPWTPREGLLLLLCTAGLLLAHAASNLLNDHMDWRLGLDRDSYFRVRYGTHPLAQGLIRPITHLLALLAVGSLALWLGWEIAGRTGTPTYWLAGAGALLMLFYTWPLKRLGLGEVVVLLVWGPLMVGGVYWVLTGDWGLDIAAISVIFGLGPTVVVFGKHTDKRRDDAARGVRTLPVLLGPLWAPRVTAALAATQVAGGLGWAWTGGRWSYLLLLAAAPALWRCVRTCLRRRPARRPRGYPSHLWPLWYTVAGFRFARASGAALVAAALLDALW